MPRTGSSRWERAQLRGLTVLPYAIYGGMVTFTLTTPHDRQLHGMGNAITRSVLDALALAFSVVAARHPNLDRRQRRPWRYVASALIALLVFDVTAVAATLDVSIGDAAAFVLTTAMRLVFLALLLRSLFLFAGPRRRSRADRWRVALDGLTVLGGGAMWTWYFVLGPALPRLTDTAARIWHSALIFTVAHLILIFGLAAVLLRGTTTTARTPMSLLLVATLVSLALELFNVNETLNQGQPEGESRLAIGRPIPDMLMASAAIEQYRLAETSKQSRQQVLGRPTWLPYAGAGAGFLALGWAAAQEMPYPWWGLVGGATLTTISAMSRQFLTLRDNDRLVAQDSLTGLASRRALLDRMGQLAESGVPVPVAVLQIDLDGFKQINDNYGHDAGDAYLAAFGTAVRDSIRRGDLAARVGGDEFAVLLVGASAVAHSIALAERILHAAQRPAVIAGRAMPIRASIGIAVSDGALDVDAIIRQADQAMYVAKRRGTHDWELYSEATAASEDAG